MKWQLNKIQYPVYNLGPGKRIGIWVQGCSLGCAGCINQTLWTPKGGKELSVLDVYNWIVMQADEFEGITISGGEPFQQYEALIAFLHLIKKKTSLTVYCFSGYYLSELNELYPDRLFYQYLDYLVDGRYISEQQANESVKGSSNQSVYQFINGVPQLLEQESTTQRWSVQVSEEGRIYMAGIPKQGEMGTLCSDLAVVGIKKTFK